MTVFGIANHRRRLLGITRRFYHYMEQVTRISTHATTSSSTRSALTHSMRCVKRMELALIIWPLSLSICSNTTVAPMASNLFKKLIPKRWPPKHLQIWVTVRCANENNLYRDINLDHSEEVNYRTNKKLNARGTIIDWIIVNFHYLPPNIPLCF